MTNIQSLRLAVGAYKHDKDMSKGKNKYRNADYEAIKKVAEGLEYFVKNLDHSCGALYPFLDIAMREIKK